MKNYINIEIITLENRSGFANQNCKECGNRLDRNKKIRLVTISDSCFRGDDSVFGFHVECGKQKNGEKLLDYIKRIID